MNTKADKFHQIPMTDQSTKKYLLLKGALQTSKLTPRENNQYHEVDSEKKEFNMNVRCIKQLLQCERIQPEITSVHRI